MKHFKTLLAITLSGLLAACGGDGDSGAEQATFSLGVSDNPFDAEIVQIAFKQVVLKNSDGAISFDVDKQLVDLLTVQGSDVEMLVSGQSVPLGEYQMCIYMENSEEPDITSSYVHNKVSNNDEGLVTNSNGSCGGVGAEEEDTGRLFFNKTFTIAAGTNTFVAEFELGEGLQSPHGNKDYWTLKPTSVQLVNESEVGAIAGQVSSQFNADCETDASGHGVAVGYTHAVYLYPGDTLKDNMDDFRTADSIAPQVAPIASARVNPVYDDSDPEVVIGYEYEFGFVVASDDGYSLGYTCVAQNDDPDLEEGITEGFIIYRAQQEVEVTVGETAVGDFPVPAP